MRYFISGHRILSFDKWVAQYKPMLDAALSEAGEFILGECVGVDTLSLEYLKDKTSKVTVCHIGKAPRYKPVTIGTHVKDWFFIGGFKDDLDRDAYMTQNSDKDLAFIDKDDSAKYQIHSGTAQNLCRRFEKDYSLDTKTAQFLLETSLHLGKSPNSIIKDFVLKIEKDISNLRDVGAQQEVDYVNNFLRIYTKKIEMQANPPKR